MRKTLISGLFFLAFFGLYLKTLSPAFHPDDSPETITACATLSIQHPPGYPLHSLLGHLAAIVLPGSPAFGINALSAMLGALGLLFFAWVLVYLDLEFGGAGALEPGLAGAAVLGLSFTLWFQSSIAKGGVYALNFLLTQAALLGLLHFRRRHSSLGLRVAALSFGLGMADHWTSQVVLLPGFGLLLLEPWWRAGRPKPAPAWAREAAFSLLLLACGFSLYLYLPLRSLLHPVLQWGEPWTASGFWWVFSRSQYAGIEAHKSLAAFFALWRQIGDDLVLEFHPAGLLALGLGWILMLRRKPWIGLSLLSLPLVLTLAVTLKANPPSDSLWVIDPYLVPAYSGLALGIAGLGLLPEAWSRFRVPALWAAALGLGVWHWPIANQSRNFLGYDYVNNLLLSCPKDTVLFCEGDSNTAGPFFQHFVLGKRRDIALVADVLSDYGWYREGLSLAYPGLKLPPQALTPPGNIDFMAKANAPRPALLTNSYNKAWMAPERVLPRGLVNRIMPTGPATLADLNANKIWDAYEIRGAFAPALNQDPITKRLVTDNYIESLANLANAYQKLGKQDQAEAAFVSLGKLRKGWAAPWVQAGNAAYFHQRLAEAGGYWQRAADEDPQSAEAQANLGIYYLATKNYDQAVACAVKALQIDPSMDSAAQLLAKARSELVHPGAAPQASPGAGAQYAATGDALAAKGAAQEALASYDQAIAAGFVSSAVYRNRAVMYGRLNRNKDAEAELQKAVNLDPKNAELRKYLGVFKFNNGDTAGALKELLKSQELNPADASLPAVIAQVRAKLKP